MSGTRDRFTLNDCAHACHKRELTVAVSACPECGCRMDNAASLIEDFCDKWGWIPEPAMLLDLGERIDTTLQHREQGVRRETITDEQIQRVIMCPQNAAWFSQYLAEYSTAKGRFEKRIEEVRAEERERRLAPDIKDWLTEQCNRLKHGQCTTRRCLVRGGYTGSGSVDYDAATCEPYEVSLALLQQPTSERCGECQLCGHEKKWLANDDTCHFPVPICADDYHGTRFCNCKCVFPATEAPHDPTSFKEFLREQLKDPEFARAYKEASEEVDREFATTGAGEQRWFEAKLLNFREDERIKLCGPCLHEAIAHALVIFSSALPVSTAPSVDFDEEPATVAEEPRLRGMSDAETDEINARIRKRFNEETSADCASASEPLLAKEWDVPEEDDAWKDLAGPTAAPVVEAAQNQLTEAARAIAKHWQMRDYNYAVRLARHLAATHFPDVTDWRPLSDMDGVLSQIDNMICAWKPSTATPGEGARERAKEIVLSADYGEVAFRAAIGNRSFDKLVEAVAAALPPTEATQVAVEAAVQCAYEAGRYFDELYLASNQDRAEGRDFDSSGVQLKELSKRFQAVISKHCHDAGEVGRLTGEVERLRKYEREVSTLRVGYALEKGLAKNFQNQIKTLRTELTTARADAIRDSMNAVNEVRERFASPELEYAPCANALNEAIAALESLAKEGEDGAK